MKVKEATEILNNMPQEYDLVCFFDSPYLKGHYSCIGHRGDTPIEIVEDKISGHVVIREDRDFREIGENK